VGVTKETEKSVGVRWPVGQNGRGVSKKKSESQEKKLKLTCGSGGEKKLLASTIQMVNKRLGRIWGEGKLDKKKTMGEEEICDLQRTRARMGGGGGKTPMRR